MAKVMNLGVHCSECVIRPFMYCMALQKRIMAKENAQVL